MLKKVQVEQSIKGGVTFGKGMRLACEGIEPITEDTVEPFNMNGSRLGDSLAQSGADLDGEQPPMLIAMLDGLCQAHVCRHHQWGTSAMPGAQRLARSSFENRGIAPPAIAAPAQRMALRACYGEGDRSLDEIVADASSGTGSNEATGATLGEASPAFTGINVVGGSVFLRTKDQNSSIPTVERCRSFVKMVVKVSACSPARRIHWPIVSYLWLVISSAARRLPRRITTRSA